MEREFLFPDIGSGLVEAEIIRWHIAVGDEVTSDQPMVEVETEKSVAEIPVPFSGSVVRLGVAEGEAIEVGEVLVVIEVADTAEALDDPPSRPSAATPVAPAVAASVPPAAKGGKAMPVIRKLAAQRGIDLATVQGTGPGGSITRADVERSVASQAAPAAGDDPIARMSKLRRTIAERMRRTWQEIPHISGHAEFVADRLLAARETLIEQHGSPIPLEALVIKALVPVLEAHPPVHGRVDGENLVSYERMDIGVAVDTPDGLLVPVVHGADQMPVLELAARIRDLADRAVARKLTSEEMSGNTFTVSNIGPFVAAHTTQILPPGTTGILSIGRATRKPVVSAAEVVVADVMPLSVSVDHRAVDGGVAARFLATLQANLEDPAAFLTV